MSRISIEKLHKMRSGQTYYRVWGWPLKRENGRLYLYIDVYQLTGKRVIDKYGFPKFKMAATSIYPSFRTSHFNTGMAVFSARRSAERFMAEALAGLHPREVRDLIDYHHELDAFDALYDDQLDERDHWPVDDDEDEREVQPERVDLSKPHNFIQYIQSLGFEMALDHAFTRPCKLDQGQTAEVEQHMYLFAKRDQGLVLKFDTFNTLNDDGSLDEGVNSAELHYAWRPHDWNDRGYTESGGAECEREDWRKDVDSSTGMPADAYWKGHHYAKANLAYTIRTLAEHGTFLSMWPPLEAPTLLFFCYQDWSDDRAFNDWTYEARSARRALEIDRYAATPAWFKAMVNIKEPAPINK